MAHGNDIWGSWNPAGENINEISTSPYSVAEAGTATEMHQQTVGSTYTQQDIQNYTDIAMHTARSVAARMNGHPVEEINKAIQQELGTTGIPVELLDSRTMVDVRDNAIREGAPLSALNPEGNQPQNAPEEQKSTGFMAAAMSLPFLSSLFASKEQVSGDIEATLSPQAQREATLAAMPALAHLSDFVDMGRKVDGTQLDEALARGAEVNVAKQQTRNTNLGIA